MRRYPHDSFSWASRSTIDRILRCTGGRPERPRRDRRAQQRRRMCRCQRKMVSGVTISRIAARRSIGSVPASSASHARPATSNANELATAHARRPRADGAASGSPRPSTMPHGATSPTATPRARRSGRSASSPQAEDHLTSSRAKTGPAHARTLDRALQGLCPGGTGFRHPHGRGPSQVFVRQSHRPGDEAEAARRCRTGCRTRRPPGSPRTADSRTRRPRPAEACGTPRAGTSPGP